MRERITSVIRVFFSPPNVCVRVCVSLVTLFRKKDVAAFGGEGDSWEIPFGGSRGRGDPLSLSLSLSIEFSFLRRRRRRIATRNRDGRQLARR